MWLLFALAAAFLTSFLPVVNKRLLVDTPVAVVAWGVNAFSLPVLGLLALALGPIPTVDRVFWLGIVGSAALNLAATLVSTQALKLGDASLVTPVLTFNPAFTLLIAALTLGEIPGGLGLLGVLVIVGGGYLLNLQQIGAGWWRPLMALVTQRATVLALAASFLWGLTPIAEKLAIEHSQPANPPVVAFGSTALMALFLVLPLLRGGAHPLRHVRAHRQGFLAAAVLAGIAPVFGFSAIALGLVGYVTAIFKLSPVFTVAWALVFLKEGAAKERLLGSAIMVLGALLIAA